ncbi:hypothetical protein G7Y79_00004g013000 [Physcia stellaris]|nr:hypothetical protein G7Y79_00004g013000 [Physcia stellaris]
MLFQITLCLHPTEGPLSKKIDPIEFKLGTHHPDPPKVRCWGLLTGIISSSPSSSKLAVTENQLLCVRLGATGSIFALTVRLSLVPGRTMAANLSSSSESLYDEERFLGLEKKLGVDLEMALRTEGEGGVDDGAEEREVGADDADVALDVYPDRGFDDVPWSLPSASMSVVGGMRTAYRLCRFA